MKVLATRLSVKTKQILSRVKFSVMSPIARALIGKSVDDVVIVVTPGGEKEYEISNVEHK